MAKKLDIAPSVTPYVEVPHVSQSRKELALKELKKCMIEESRLVKGLFQNFEHPGATQMVSYKKYPTPSEMRKRGTDGGVEPFSKAMTDGCEYEIPLYVARFLNGTDVTAGLMGDEKKNSLIGSCSYAIHGFRYEGETPGQSQLGAGAIPVPVSGVTKRVKRFGFQSLEFAHGNA